MLLDTSRNRCGRLIISEPLFYKFSELALSHDLHALVLSVLAADIGFVSRFLWIVASADGIALQLAGNSADTSLKNLGYIPKGISSLL